MPIKPKQNSNGSKSLNSILNSFDRVKKRSDGSYSAKCPAHTGRRNTSLRITDRGDKILPECLAGCDVKDVLGAVGLKECDLLLSPSKSTAHLHTMLQHNETTSEEGGRVCRYAEGKHLPESFLLGLGLSDCKRKGKNAIRISYYNKIGEEMIVRYQVSLTGKDKFRWRTGSKAKVHGLYGLWRLDKKLDSVIIVEGESDCHTLWYHKYNALGIPGASIWNEQWTEYLEPFKKIIIFIEKDQGGEAVKKWLAASSIRDRAYIVLFGPDEDPSSIHIQDPDNFKTRVDTILESAVSWRKIENDMAKAEEAEAWASCRMLAKRRNLLRYFAHLLPRLGLIGESKNAQLIFLSLVTRLFDRPNSIVVEGPSSVGKSYLVDTVLKFFPESAYYTLSSMSEKALVYTDESLEHRFLIFYEAGGITTGQAEYFIRTLLSEGRLMYEYVKKTSDGFRPCRIEKNGPTGLITTTTKVSRNPENETRLLAISISDESSQTKAILRSLAADEVMPVNLEIWKALQIWLSYGERRVFIPYTSELADLTKPVAIRLRRDFAAMLSLIKAHALLHRENRERDRQGRIIATIDDYKIVRDLISDIVSVGVGVKIPESVRDTVGVVSETISKSNNNYATYIQIAKKLGIDRTSAVRRVETAVKHGLLLNTQNRKGRRAKIILGHRLPENDDIFPTVDVLEREMLTEKTTHVEMFRAKDGISILKRVA